MICKAATKLVNSCELTRFEETCSRILFLCNSKSLKVGFCVHSPVIKLGLQDNIYLQNNLLSVYAKCCELDEARKVFDEMPQRDVVSWTSMVSAYVKNESPDSALRLFDEMVSLGESPNEFTLSSVLRSCAALGELSRGACLQGFVIKSGFELNRFLGTGLIDLYSKCGCSEEAYKLFGCLDNGDTVSWTTMISSFVQTQQWRDALGLYGKMIEAGVPPNEFTFVKLLAASRFLGVNFGKLLHAHVIIWGVRLNLVLKTAIVDLYSKWQMMEDAIRVSNLTPESDVLLWTSVISGFTDNLRFREAFSAFQEMQISGIKPTNFTYSSILNACSSAQSLDLGRQIHGRVIGAGLEDDVSVGNSLVDMYMKCSQVIENGWRVFTEINSPNVISWTSLIAGLVDHGFVQDSFESFVEMRAAGVQPNSFTVTSILRGCSETRSLWQTLILHGYIIKTKADDEIAVANALVDAYAALGIVNDAWQVISKMNQRDAITYTSLATRTNQMGDSEMALNIINHMYNDDVKMDAFSLTSFFSASSSFGTFETGKQLHSHSIKSGLSTWISVLNGLVGFYGKSGDVHNAHRAFKEITEPNVVSWNGLISGLASNGYISSALSTFDDMRLAGTKPDSVTFLRVLSACSHGKLVNLGLEYFQCMRERYDILPQFDHYVCLVDLLSRGGQLEEAIGVVEKMPFRPDALIYKTLLSACRVHKNLSLGEDIARRGLEINPSDPVFYTLLANLYDESGQAKLGEMTRQLMKERGLRKNPGWSWVEIKSKMHFFASGDSSSQEINEIHQQIEQLINEFKHRGYLYRDKGETSHHSTKLAAAFALLNTPSMAAIRIVKNTHMCKDCHNFIILTTQVIEREVIIREGNRIHSFRNGECSCRGNWLFRRTGEDCYQ